MMALIWILLLLTAVLILSYQRASLSVATMGVSVLLLMLSILIRPPIISLIVIWVIWVLLAILLNVRPLRRWLISARVFTVVSRHTPKFSPTEQAVLAAGNVGWEVELFSGMPDLNQLVAMPWVQLNSQEQAFLAGPVTALCEMIDPWWIYTHQQIPDAIWQYLKKHGFFGLVIPEQYGGKGFSAFAHAQVVMKLASASTAVSTIASVPNSLGPAELLLHYGTEEQKNYYLPRLASGEEVPCFALTSPVAGSDASAIIDSGVVCRFEKNGAQILGIRLNWNKRYITLAPVATILGLAFQLYDPEHLLGDIENIGITCALIPTNTPGISIGRHHNPLNCPFPNGPTQGVDVLVELETIIGGLAQAGKGWQMLMERLAAGRSISLPSITAGSVKIAAASTGAYARVRRQFNTYIGDFGGVQNVLAKMLNDAHVAESLRLFSIAQVDQNIHSATAAAMSKYHTTELGRQVISAAMDIHGGKGICMGPNNYLAQRHIDSPIAITVEGANILTRSLIIFGQGALRCHPVLLQEITAIHQADKKAFDRAFFTHLGYLISNQVRAFILGLTNGFFVAVPKSANHYYYQQLSRCSAVFALITDILLITVGGALKRQEQLSVRLSDLLSDLYMISAVLKHHQAQQEHPAMSPLVAWSCQQLLAHFHRQCHELLVNLPNRFAAWWLRISIFIGPGVQPPSDRLTMQIAKLLMEPGEVRNQIAAEAFFGKPLAGLENSLQQIIAIEPLLRKVYHAKHQQQIDGHNIFELIIAAQEKQIISEAEASQMHAAEKLRMTMINVDDF